MRPKPTATDYIVMALSPALIMALVGSLCYFLINVRSKGEMDGPLCWVMFWFVMSIVLISRVAIEEGKDHAAVLGFALAGVLWLRLAQTSPDYLLGLLLMALIWFCAHKLVWDCTLIDEDADASGQGLLQGPALKLKMWLPKSQPNLTLKPKRHPSESPGRSVIYFSLAALPLFGLGQVLLPAGATSARRFGFTMLVIYLAAALGLLVTTSFLGLRRYLRQRYLPMPASIAFGWVKFGGGVSLFILIGAMFLPRPGAGVAWITLSKQVDEQLRQASRYASRSQKAQPGKGRAADQTSDAGKQDSTKPNSEAKEPGGKSSGQDSSPSGQAAGASSPVPALSGQAASIYYFLRNTLLIIGALVVGWWLIRSRQLLLEMCRSIMTAFRKFLLLDLPKPVRPTGPVPILPPRRPLAEFHNPFFAGDEHSRPLEEIILYTYDAVQAWAREQGIEGHPEQTPREFCQEMSAQLPDMSASLRQLSFLYAHAAYGRRLPADCDMEPLKELWRRLTWK